MTKSSYALAAFLALAIALPFILNPEEDFPKRNNGLRMEKRQVSSGIHYDLFYAGNLRLAFTTTRPEKNDTQVYFCIAGAFTDMQTNKVDGLYVEQGNVSNRESVNHNLGGAIRISRTGIDIFPTNRGKLFNDSFLHILSSDQSSLFQQIQMIHQGVGDTYTDEKVFQRRAIIKFRNKDIAIIESGEAITLARFTADLLELGVYSALYTDMGTWDEGWYRAEEKISTIGKLKSQTARQSNWIVLKSK